MLRVPRYCTMSPRSGPQCFTYCWMFRWLSLSGVICKSYDPCFHPHPLPVQRSRELLSCSTSAQPTCSNLTGWLCRPTFRKIGQGRCFDGFDIYNYWLMLCRPMCSKIGECAVMVLLTYMQEDVLRSLYDGSNGFLLSNSEGIEKSPKCWWSILEETAVACTSSFAARPGSAATRLWAWQRFQSITHSFYPG